ncbi:MAG: hypothetical protein A2W35_02650 [Chloroflexi bacterium RBG_16_57_11]|nr:MAG: hypothetical protein A2W35_02650 [Chloroflexi bacterium RBG_16_57_11]
MGLRIVKLAQATTIVIRVAQHVDQRAPPSQLGKSLLTEASQGQIAHASGITKHLQRRRNTAVPVLHQHVVRIAMT